MADGADEKSSSGRFFQSYGSVQDNSAVSPSIPITRPRRHSFVAGSLPQVNYDVSDSPSSGEEEVIEEEIGKLFSFFKNKF